MDETTNLKAEIERLNKIISILINEIGIIKAENAILKSENGIKQSFNAVHDIEKGAKQLFNTIQNFEKGSKQIYDTILDLKKGIKPDFGLITPDKIAPNSENASVKAPEKIEINNINSWQLGNALQYQRVFHEKSKRRKYYRVACELLLMHNNGLASSDELRNIAGLSKAGYAKHAPTLRHAGLILRQPHRKYMLTEKSKEMINKVFGEKLKP